jgi:hypothetical protein
MVTIGVRLMTMKHAAERRPLTLFPPPGTPPAPLDFETRLRDFARAAAERRRGVPADVERFVCALRGYHRAWTVCSRTAVPELDDRAVRIAVAAYCAATGDAKKPAA